jgi:hypothetical protein
MGLLGSAIGGALAGVGAGMQQNIVEQRQIALENMRMQFQTNLQEQGFAHADQTQQAGFDQQSAMADKAHQDRIDELQTAGKIDIGKMGVEFEHDMKKLNATFVNQKGLAQLESQLSQGRTESEIRLRDQLDSGDISTVVRAKDGTYWGVTKDGLVPTGVKADITAAEVKSDGGGYLDKDAREAAYSDDHKAWVANTSPNKGPEPKRSDYVSMTHADYAARNRTATPDAPAPDPEKTKQLTVALTQLQSRYATATPQTAPGLFVNGQKISLAAARAKMIETYGGQ